MTKKEKQLLLKDLCTRFPYGVKGLHRGQVHELFTIDGREVNSACIQVDGYDAWFSVDTFKPYLRSMSSMTEEERNNLRAYCRAQEGIIYDIGVSGAINSPAIIDWLNANHFDYRGLIEKGLALKAPDGMYENN